MSETMILYSGVLLLGTFISAVSQVILKKAALKTYPSKIPGVFKLPGSFCIFLVLAYDVHVYICV